MHLGFGHSCKRGMWLLVTGKGGSGKKGENERRTGYLWGGGLKVMKCRERNEEEIELTLKPSKIPEGSQK